MKNAAAFVWRDNYLIAANHAPAERLFGERGLRALCYCTLTGKTVEDPDLTGFNHQQLLDHYQKEKLRHYENTNALAEHIGLEDSFSQAYFGRLFLELLQNATDAISGKPIGHKGLGFRVTTRFAESIRIHSGDLHFQFSREHARELVKAHSQHDEPTMHLLSVPDAWDTVQEEPFIQDLIHEFDTVIVLKLRRESAEVLKALNAQWKEITDNPSTMLFLPAIEQLSWTRETTTTSWVRESDPENSERVTLIVNGATAEQWMVRGDSEKAQIAVRVEKDSPTPLPPDHEDSKRVRTFFRTNEANPVSSFLLHLNLPLEQNRDHFSDGAVDSRPQALDEAAKLIADFVAELPDCGLALDFLRWPSGVNEVVGLEPKIARPLWNKIRSAVRKRHPVEYPPATRFSCLRGKPDGCWFEHWEAAKTFMIERATMDWKTHGFLPHGKETSSRCETLLRLEASAKWTTSALKKLPLFPVEGSDALHSPAVARIFTRPKFEVGIVPPEIGAEFVTESFQASLKDFNNAEAKKLITEQFGLHQFSFESICEECVVPALKKGTISDRQRLIDFLWSIFPRADAKHDKPFSWANQVQAGLCNNLEVLCDDERWRQAKHVYASESWEASAVLIEYCKRVPRHFLAPRKPELSADDFAAWKRFYSWIGVGWCPKVLPIIPLSESEANGSKKGFKMVETKYGLPESPDIPLQDWQCYCRSFVAQAGKPHRKPSLEYESRMKRNWCLDGKLAEMHNSELLTMIDEHWSYYAQYLKCSGHRSTSRTVDHDSESWEAESYLAWCLREHDWVHSLNGKTWRKPSELFIDGPVTQHIGDWIPRPTSEPQIEEFCKALGFRQTWEQVQELWDEMLNTALVLQAAEKVECRGRIKKLYVAFLQRQQVPKLNREWWAVIRHDGGHGDQWVARVNGGSLYYLDSLHFEPLCTDRVPLFPVELNTLGASAKRLIGAKPLSEAMVGTVLWQQHALKIEKFISDRLAERLEVVCHFLASNHEPVERENYAQACLAAFQQIKICCVSDLSVRLSLDSQDLGLNSNLEFWVERQPEPDSHSTLWVDVRLVDGREHVSWDILARGLSACPSVNISAVECSAVEKLLAASIRADIEREMRQLGLPLDQMLPLLKAVDSLHQVEALEAHKEETVEGSLVASPVVHPPSQPLPTDATPAPEPIYTGRPEPQPIDSKTRVHSLRENRSRSRTDGEQRQDHKIAREAEAWLREQIRQHLKGKLFLVDEGVHRDDERRESDIHIRSADETDHWHIEAKHLSGNTIYWSELEITKAKIHAPRYLMALLSGGAEPFQVRWLWSPLDELGDLASSLFWIWPEARSLPVDHPPEWDWLDVGASPERPAKEPSRSHRIAISSEILERPPESIPDALERLLSKT